MCVLARTSWERKGIKFCSEFRPSRNPVPFRSARPFIGVRLAEGSLIVAIPPIPAFNAHVMECATAATKLHFRSRHVFIFTRPHTAGSNSGSHPILCTAGSMPASIETRLPTRPARTNQCFEPGRFGFVWWTRRKSRPRALPRHLLDIRRIDSCCSLLDTGVSFLIFRLFQALRFFMRPSPPPLSLACTLSDEVLVRSSVTQCCRAWSSQRRRG